MNTQPIGGMLAIAFLLMNAVIFETALLNDPGWYNALWLTLPLLVIALYQFRKKRSPVHKGHTGNL